jgi:hypothetical protein
VVQVPLLLAQACSELLAMRNLAATAAAPSVAVQLVKRAVIDLEPLPDDTVRVNSNSHRGTSKLTAMLWEQLEQSGLLQQLPDAMRFLSSHICTAASQLPDHAGRVKDARLTKAMFDLVDSLPQLLPSYFTAQTECMVPATQLCHSSMQYLSSLVAQPGPQQWMDSSVFLPFCQVAAGACAHAGSMLTAAQGQQQTDNTRAQLAGANQAVVQLSTAVLQKLLSEWRSLPDSGLPCTDGSGTSGNSSSSTGNSSSSSSSSSILMQSCQHVVATLAAACMMSGTASTWKEVSTPETDAQLPIQHIQCCKLLQDCVRVAAPAAAAAAATEPFSHFPKPGFGLFGSVCLLLGEFGGYGTYVRASSGLLVAPCVAAGDFGGPCALQLFGLLCSLLKACSITSDRLLVAALPLDKEQGRVLPPQEQDVSTAVLAAVSCMLKGALNTSSGACSSSTAGSSSSSGGASSSAASLSSCSSSGSTPCATALTWLWLLGRCCCVSAALTQQLSAVPGRPSPAGDPRFEWSIRICHLKANLAELLPSLAAVVEWLAATDTVQQLTALGYQPEQLRQQLGVAAAALLAFMRDLPDWVKIPYDDSATVATLKQIQEQLQAAVKVLATFANPHACNNPACGNVCGASEAQLVGGRSCICAGCCIARYCGRDCQRAAWRQHKPVCKALAAAAVAAAEN